MILEEAQKILMDNAAYITKSDNCNLLNAVGQIILEDVIAPFDNPPFNRSPLDGYALRSEDITKATAEKPVILSIIAEECAGDFYAGAVEKNECIRIMTGAAIPADCDCVIRQEDITLLSQDKVAIPYSLKHHQNFCFKGEDIREGSVLIKAGTVLKAAHIGVLASMGYTEIKTAVKPSILIASTGDELLSPGEALKPGKIYNSNIYVLAARLQEMGFAAVNLGILPDNPERAAERLKQKAEEIQADLIITTGGVSVGKKDIMHDVVRLIGEKLFWRVSMKPGSPVLTYKMGNSLGIALSGNPFAAYTTFELLVRPVLAKLTGDISLNMQSCEAVLADSFNKKSIGRRFVRGYFKAGMVYLPDNHASGSLFSAASCNCFVDIPAGSPALAAGSLVKIFLI